MIAKLFYGDGFMRLAWLCIWAAFGLAEIVLTLWSHSAAFPEIGAVIPVMIGYNLLRGRARAPEAARIALEITPAEAVIG